MEKALPDYIKENKDLRQALLKQDGFMKYVAERIEAGDDGLSIYAHYQEHVFTIYCKANSWKPDSQLMSDDELWLKALGPDNHLLKEFRYLIAMERSLEGVPEEAAKAVRDFHDGYMGYAWREFFERRNPEHATDVGFYKMFMEQFLSPNGLAHRCLDIVLKIHHGKGLTEIDRYDYYRIAEYYYFYFDEFEPQGKRAYDRLRRGVKEWLDGKDGEKCRELTIDMLLKVRFFSQHIYNDEAVCTLNGRPFPLEDKRWLRQTASRIGKLTKDARFYFSEFVNILAEVGHIWAARLLKEHKIDMHELEENFHSYLQPYNPGKDGFDYYYYIDHHYTTDSPNTCCVNNYDKAKELICALHKIKQTGSQEEQTGETAQPTAAMEASTGKSNKDGESDRRKAPPHVYENWKPGAKPTNFKDYIVRKEDTDKVMGILNNNINKNSPKLSALVIIGGIEAGIISPEVTAPSIKREFGVNEHSIKPYLTKYRTTRDNKKPCFPEEVIKPYKDLFIVKE